MSGQCILHIIPTLGVGGAEQFLATLLPALKSRGHDCSVGVLGGPPDLEQRFQEADVPVHRLDVGHRWNLPSGAWRVSRLVRHVEPDLVHSHLFFATIYNGLSRPLDEGVKRVVTFHNLAYAAYPPTTPWKKMRRGLHGKLVRDAFDGVTAVSREVADHYHANLGCGINRVIPNAVNLGAIERVEARRIARSPARALDDDHIAIISPGRLVPEKGHRYLIRAVSSLFEEGLSPRLTIFGRGPLQADLQSEIDSLQLTQRIRIHEPIPQDQLFDQLLDTDVVVFPSTHEGFGIGAAEAMALGLPVIASRVGGLQEIIEHEKTGLLVEPGDPSELASAIRRIAASPKFASQLGSQAREDVRARVSPAAVAQQYEEFYQSILGF